MTTLKWNSLKSILINNLRLSINYATNDEGKVLCSRADLRLFINYHPTSYGVNLKRAELWALIRFCLKSLTDNKAKFVDNDLIMECVPEGVSIQKRRHRLFITNQEIVQLINYSSGVAYIMGLIVSNGENYLDDAYIYSSITKENTSLSLEWPEEEMLKSGKIPTDAMKYLKQNSNKLWDNYNNIFGKLIPLNRNEFMLRVNGSFIKNLMPLYQQCPNDIRSLSMVLKAMI